MKKLTPEQIRAKLCELTTYEPYSKLEGGVQKFCDWLTKQIVSNTAEDEFYCPECGEVAQLLNKMTGTYSCKSCANTAEVDCLVCREKLMYSDKDIAMKLYVEYLEEDPPDAGFREWLDRTK